MKKIRDFVYIKRALKDNRIDSYGIEFYEFMSVMLPKIEHMLILRGNPECWGTFTNILNRELIDKKELPILMKESVYNYGDFVWLDVLTIESLEKLTPNEIAEMYYLENKWTPISSPHFNHINNLFFYIAHDDGWFNRCYYRNLDDFYNVISESLLQKLNVLFRLRRARSISAMQVRQLGEVSVKGIVIDLLQAKKEKNAYIIPVYGVGEYRDMDLLNSDLRENNKEWEILFKLKIE